MKEAYYFSHDANARNDPKIVAMRATYGYEGYGWYWAIVEMLRDEARLKLSYSKAYAWLNLASSLGIEASRARQFVDDCINQFELLKCDGEFFWSDSLIRRMEARDEQRAKLREAGRKGGLSSAQARLKHGSSQGQAKLKPPSTIKRKEKKEKETSSLDDDVNALQPVTDFWQQNIGVMGPHTYERLAAYVEDDGLPPDLILWACEQAVAHGVRNLAYVEKILQNCRDQNIRTRAEALAEKSGAPKVSVPPADKGAELRRQFQAQLEDRGSETVT